jgi:hypothetical protein
MKQALGNLHSLKKVWELTIDDETGKLCFLNEVSGEKLFQIPVGLKLSKEDQELWQKG